MPESLQPVAGILREVPAPPGRRHSSQHLHPGNAVLLADHPSGRCSNKHTDTVPLVLSTICTIPSRRQCFLEHFPPARPSSPSIVRSWAETADIIVQGLHPGSSPGHELPGGQTVWGGAGSSSLWTPSGAVSAAETICQLHETAHCSIATYIKECGIQEVQGRWRLWIYLPVLSA